MSWSKPRTIGMKPPAVYGHSMSFFPRPLDSKIFFFGGRNASVCENSLAVLELGKSWRKKSPSKQRKKLIISLPNFGLATVDSMTWCKSLSCSGEPPSPRLFHSATSFGDKIFVFGGRNDEAMCDVLLYSIDLGKTSALCFICFTVSTF